MKKYYVLILSLLTSTALAKGNSQSEEKIVLTHPEYRCQDIQVKKKVYTTKTVMQEKTIYKKVGRRTIPVTVKVPKTIRVPKVVMEDRSLWWLASYDKSYAKSYPNTCRSYGPIAERFGIVPTYAHDGWVCIGSRDLKNQSFWYTRQGGIESGKIYDYDCWDWANFENDEYFTLENYEKTINIKIADGSEVRGIYDKSDKGATSIAFKGIPYAKAPIGNLRWKITQPIGSIGKYDASKFGPACPQVVKEGSVLSKYIPQVGMSEDCLHLNVWKPMHTNRNSKLPVVVWIHGGGLNIGVSHQESYRGANMANKGVIFVSMNYRLGMLGFFAHQAQNANQPRGNYGLYDQMEALKWIQKNIKSFGGDPNNITLMGESAGASSVMYHLTSDKSKDLFHKAVMQSTPVLINHPPIDGANESSPFAFTAVQTSGLLANKIGCKSTNARTELNCLMKYPAKALVNQAQTLRAGFYIDGYMHDTHPRVIATEEGLHHMPIIIGSNEDEYTFFGRVPHKSVREYKNSFINTFGAEVGQELLSLYPAKNMTEMKDSYYAFHTDYMFGIDAAFLASMNVLLGHNHIYHYHFSKVSPGAEKKGLGASHGLEIAYFFDNISSTLQNGFYDESDQRVANEMSQRFVNFAYSGSPNGNFRTHWSQYTPFGESLLIDKRTSQKQNHLKKEGMTLLEAKQQTIPVNIPRYLRRLLN